MIADDALDQDDDAVQLRATIHHLSDFLGRAMHEGRAALQSLRESTKQTSNLAGAFRDAIAECRLPENMNAVFSVEGEPRHMHPIVRDEVYRIGYEAIQNACRHSGGSLLEVTLNYDTNLILKVRDDGKGIEPDCLEDGRDGHYGLRGMRERAERIRAQLDITTQAATGTKIVLTMSTSAIYNEDDSVWLRLTKNFRVRRKCTTRFG